MNCPVCNRELPDNIKFCSKCGYKFGVFEKIENTGSQHPGNFPAPATPAQSHPVKPATSGNGQIQQSMQPPGTQLLKPPPLKSPSKPSRAMLAAADEAKMSGYILSSFIYPFRGSGILIIIFGTILLLILKITIDPIFKVLTAIGVGGYMALYYFNIINMSSLPESRNEPPDWPDVATRGDLVSAFFMIFCLYFFSFLPATCYIYYATVQCEKNPDPVILLLSLIWGAIYFPMGSILLAETRNFISALPFVVLKCIGAAPAKYYAICSVFLMVTASSQMALQLVSHGTNLQLKILVAIITSFFSVYSLIVMGRILGLFYKDLIK